MNAVDLVGSEQQPAANATTKAEPAAAGVTGPHATERRNGWSRALAQVPASVFSDDVAGPSTVIAAAQATPELGEVYMSVNGRGLRKELATFYNQLQRSGAGSVAAALNNAPERTSAMRAKKAVACLLWMNGVTRARMDQALTQPQRESDAAGAAQAVAARTQDVLPAVLEVVRLVSPAVDPARLALLGEELPVQLELGVPRSCVALGRRFGQGLPRSCYLVPD